MRATKAHDRYVVARESNVVRVDFSREPDPPAPKFPGAGALRESCDQSISHMLDAVAAAASAKRSHAL